MPDWHDPLESGVKHTPHGSRPSFKQHTGPPVVLQMMFFPVQQTSQDPFVKHLPGQHVFPHRFLPFLQEAVGAAVVPRGATPKSAAASKARQAVRRDPDAAKRWVSRSKVWWSIAYILRSEHAGELRYIVTAKYPSARATGEVAVVTTR
jgi:hypothetical protein